MANRQACPNLVAAHIRSDQISYPFFHQLAGRGSDLPSGTQSPVEGQPGDVGAAKPGKLRLLRLQHSHNSSKPKDPTLYVNLGALLAHLQPQKSYSECPMRTDGASAVEEYAKLACQAESSGIAWPTDASQKDLLMRLNWVVEAVQRRGQPGVRPLPDQAGQEAGGPMAPVDLID